MPEGDVGDELRRASKHDAREYSPPLAQSLLSGKRPGSQTRPGEMYPEESIESNRSRKSHRQPIWKVPETRKWVCRERNAGQDVWIPEGYLPPLGDRLLDPDGIRPVRNQQIAEHRARPERHMLRPQCER